MQQKGTTLTTFLRVPTGKTQIPRIRRKLQGNLRLGHWGRRPALFRSVWVEQLEVHDGAPQGGHGWRGRNVKIGFIKSFA